MDYSRMVVGASQMTDDHPSRADPCVSPTFTSFRDASATVAVCEDNKV